MDYISSKAQYVTSVISPEISEQLVRKVYESLLLKKHWVQTKRGSEKKVSSVTHKQTFTARACTALFNVL